MYDFLSYRKFVTLANGKKLLLRLLNDQDGGYLTNLFQDLDHEETRFSRNGLWVFEPAEGLFQQINYLKALPLVAVDLKECRFGGYAVLSRGSALTPHMGEVRLVVSQAFDHRELGSLLLAELIALGVEEDLRLIKAVVAAGHEPAVHTFLTHGFEISARLPDFPGNRPGGDRDVFLMLRPCPGRP